jgi:CRISPR-associated protein Cas6
MKRIIDLQFQVFGNTLKVDHGYALFSAVCDLLPVFHAGEDIALSLIRGKYIGDGLLSIAPSSSLIFRLPAQKVAGYINLAGKSLDISGHNLRVGVPRSHPLIPAAGLYSHLVTTKNGQDQQRFEREMTNQLDKLACKGKVAVGKRRTFKVHGKQIVGYSVLVSELTAEGSITLQENGLGGRRKMGCGFFLPWEG